MPPWNAPWTENMRHCGVPDGLTTSSYSMKLIRSPFSARNACLKSDSFTSQVSCVPNNNNNNNFGQYQQSHDCPTFGIPHLFVPYLLSLRFLYTIKLLTAPHSPLFLFRCKSRALVQTNESEGRIFVSCQDPTKHNRW